MGPAIEGAKSFVERSTEEEDERIAEMIASAIVSRFETIGVAGRGSSSVVLKAWDTETDSLVAIKVLRPTSGLSGTGRFSRERRIAGTLDHPNIVPLLDSGEAAGLRYFVMPFVEGETLRDKMRREGQLPIDEAVRIASEIGAGLAHAHEAGVVHRDVKPENVLLADGRTLLTDFGIAKAVYASVDTFRTSTGHIVGTSSYMSPEHAGGQEVDGRSDLYSLGCVLHEMLTGDPPFLGSTVQSVVLKHMSEPPPSARVVRPSVPPGLADALQRLLAKAPADRPQTAEELIAVLGAQVSGTTSLSLLGRWRRLPRLVRHTVSAITALVPLMIAGGLWRSGTLDRLDPMRIAVFPLGVGEGRNDFTPLDTRLVDAIGWWDETLPTDRIEVSDILRAEGTGPLSVRRAGVLARRMDAGRYVMGSLEERGAVARLEAAIYDSGSPRRPLFTGVVRFPAGDAPPDSLLRSLSDVLISGGQWEGDGAVGPAGTRSLSARRSYGAAMQLMAEWDLDAAAEPLRAAVEDDPAFVLANLRLAETHNWRGEPVEYWERAAALAERGLESLSEDDRLRAAGLTNLARGRFREACDIYDVIVSKDDLSFSGWYGAGECRRRDSIVVRDQASPSGWRFRSSQTDAADYYGNAFRVVPASHRAFRKGGFLRVQELLLARGHRTRFGWEEGRNGRRFIGTLTSVADTVLYVPNLWDPLERQYDAPPLERMEAARIRQREKVRDIAALWAAAHPSSADAVYGVAIALEMLGDPAAVDSLRRAREMEDDRAKSREIATAEVWALVKHGAPDSLSWVKRARALADSLLERTTPLESDNPAAMASLAALLGRPGLAADYAERELVVGRGLPDRLERLAVRLTLAAASRGDSAHLHALEGDLWDEIEARHVADGKETARLRLIERAAFLAFPSYRSRLFEVDHALQSPVATAQRAWVRGQTAMARAELRRSSANLLGLRGSSIAIEVVLGEANLMAEMGDPAGALQRLAPVLDGARWIQPGTLRGDPVRAAAFVQALAIRAELAWSLGDPDARRWAQAALELWDGGETSTQARLASLRSVVAETNP